MRASDEKAIKYAIDIVELSKTFRRKTLSKGNYTTLKSALFSIFRNRESSGDSLNHALKSLTCRIPQGASVGVIGRNGSGKSTLLKLITGIYRPSTGSVRVNGRVAALIELGAGFHPDFSGRENLFLSAVMMGLTKKEIEERFDAIVEFAGLKEVIDDPVRTYSSGMFMRLGFSIAVHTDPDLLLIDEVLSVGDAAFVRKCKDRVSELKSQGKTLLLVSHDLDSIERWCDEVIWLHRGEVKDRGEPRRVIDEYRKFLEKGEELEIIEETAKAPAEELHIGRPEQERWGSREVEITSVEILSGSGVPHSLFHPEDKLKIRINFCVRDRAMLKPQSERPGEANLVFGLAIHRSDGVLVYGSNTDIEKIRLNEIPDSGEITLSIDRVSLLEGSYVIDAAAHRFDGYPFDYRKHVLTFAVRVKNPEVGVFTPPHSWEIPAAASALRSVVHD